MRIDLSGRRFGMLEVVSFSHTQKRLAYWSCKCDCGQSSIACGANLRSGHTKSCGCLIKSVASERGKEDNFKIYGELTQELLKEWFEYKDGNFYWKKRGAIGVSIGDVVGNVGKDKYTHVSIKNKRYLLHRLIWLFHYGKWPSKFIDHINGDRRDSRIENLREATMTQNSFNKPKRKNCSSKYKGVHLNKKRNKWVSQIKINGKSKNLGYFDVEEDAAKAYNECAKIYHGEFFNEG